MIVPFSAAGGVVVVRIVIDGIVSWGYTYTAEEHQFHATGTHNNPNDHALGLPAELHMDVNTWRVAVFNTADDAQSFAIRLSWHQDGSTLALWPPDGPLEGTLEPNEATVHDDHAVMVAV